MSNVEDDDFAEVRAVVAQAMGVLMYREHVGRRKAFELLVLRATESPLSLIEVAANVVASATTQRRFSGEERD